MDRMLGAATLLSLGVALLVPLAPALAQGAPPPGSTINGTVPTSEGNVWNGMDHQPTPSEVPPASAQQQAKINHKLSKLDQQLLNYKLPKLPKGAPPITGN
jgi:hypothetical protein